MASAASKVFVDTAFVYALINTRDEWHSRAVEWQARLTAQARPLLTTQFVVMEIGDGLASLKFRSQAMRIIEIMNASPFVEIIPASPRLVEAAVRLYGTRDDKDWGMTDCSSFIAMREHGITDVLTMDVHFQQAGFHPLLLASE